MKMEWLVEALITSGTPKKKNFVGQGFLKKWNCNMLVVTYVKHKELVL